MRSRSEEKTEEIKRRASTGSGPDPVEIRTHRLHLVVLEREREVVDLFVMSFER